jgi:CRP/FNR family transcriptional regulator
MSDFEYKRQVFEQANFPAVCQACSARVHGICGALKAPELQDLNRYTKQRPVKKGDVITFDQDDVVEYANIVSGVVKLSKILTDGRQQIVGIQFAPEFVGRPFSGSAKITAEAATDLEICVLPKAALENMLDKAHEFERRLFEQTLEQLDAAREWMVTLGRKTAAEKVASFLYLLTGHIAQPLGSGRGVAFDLPLTRADMADFLGLTVETVSRQMTKLRKARIIEIEAGHHIVVPKLSALKAASETDSDE